MRYSEKRPEPKHLRDHYISSEQEIEVVEAEREKTADVEFRSIYRTMDLTSLYWLHAFAGSILLIFFSFSQISKQLFFRLSALISGIFRISDIFRNFFGACLSEPNNILLYKRVIPETGEKTVHRKPQRFFTEHLKSLPTRHNTTLRIGFPGFSSSPAVVFRRMRNTTDRT